ncbi:bifunctional demethylmenaquinone methyltransferase/2-methoxy-6-polyprenyl-1,4-benzoquinol methylase UbiE [Limosilactobacillus sp. STM2_1]|uniref:Demethylmenaquinone methyltransferase n=1 Tax=Limosilactobacillus rudii TaxID=2759755 RepID=A0A7W3UL14_9LACO|nr:bifunctional demethylmenaquinone methyltransferase/2-methoxy-6-polyprenyl-1,4-benzoquinol methylase UbiE [Limosilactobacillus rudii]MBB1080266.1 bifunctional demethylmenaquinone methyltransferase/2-methoxy-6-polyprenyl-1,4-benzoquinol methylase UbiE [Limosilactobacillus rudii]MBB1096830.1 bifunctional demethylmenaquinone methyltransferase/2-methoxy-6-polyprenyl-1,4-benzoquinol methylase UbiE [Limosilactobacillus rudii]MCD7133727.1 bifunctional demethylmenaquinone methyltransferase/2-methoxy-6
MVQTNKLLNEHQVNALFSRVAPNYDLLNNVISLGTQKLWRKTLFNQLTINPHANALDVCCGTGDLTIELAKRIPRGRVTGLDFNQKMLELAFEKTKSIGNLFLIQGDAMKLPFDDNSFDIVTIGFGLRNVPDADQALSEIYRVLKPGGQFVSLEMSQPTNPIIKLGWKAYFTAFPVMASLAGGHFKDYQYLKKTSQQFVSAHQLARMMRAVGFRKVHYQPLNFGAAALHFGDK